MYVIEDRNVNDYEHRTDALVYLVQEYFNLNIADSDTMWITLSEASALVDLIVAET